MARAGEQLAAGMGYVPGIARGPLRTEPAPGSILLADHDALRTLATWPAGCVLREAAPFSHACIALLSRGIPTVILAEGAGERLEEGVEVVIDGAAGLVHAAPVDACALTPAPTPVPEDLRTRDGEPVVLRVSVRTADGARRAREAGAAGVGLVRSEFLLPPDARAPGRAFYRDAFAAILEAAAPLPVTVRLLDLAPDKHPPWAAALPRSGALGLHGSRLYGDPRVAAVVDAQLAALAELCPRHPLRILVPNVATVAGLARWQEHVAGAMGPCGTVVGPMLETAGTVLLADRFLAASELVGIGLNDLMQSLYGADRDLPAVGGELDPYAPGVYRLLAEVARRAGPGAGRVQLCGILPQLPGVLPVLLGLGYRTFSVDVAHVPYLARAAAARTCAEDRALAAAVTASGSAQEVRLLLRKRGRRD